MKRLVLIFLLVATSIAVKAQLRLPKLISDGMGAATRCQPEGVGMGNTWRKNHRTV